MSETSKKVNESEDYEEKTDKERSGTTVESQETMKSQETEQQNNDAMESEEKQEPVKPASSSQQESDIFVKTEPSDRTSEISETKLQIVPVDSSPRPAEFPSSSEKGKDSPVTSESAVSVGGSVTQETSETRPQSSQEAGSPVSVRRVITWTMTGFFDFNPHYFAQLRGLGNILHIVLSLTDIVILGLACQLRPYPEGLSEGFYCKPPETFLFNISCSSFISSTLYLFCCVFSKSTDLLLFQSSFEICYFTLYFIMFLTASLTLIVSEINWETSSRKSLYESDFESTQIAAVVGLLNSIIYGISAVWYLVSHRSHRENVITLNNQA